MNENQRAALVQAQAVAAQIEMEAMKASNARRETLGMSPAYAEEDFMELISKYGIDHNGAVSTLQGQ